MVDLGVRRRWGCSWNSVSRGIICYLTCISHKFLLNSGPCRVTNSNATTFHIHSWNEKANVFFVDQPIGVGFSYADYGEYVVSSYCVKFLRSLKVTRWVSEYYRRGSQGHCFVRRDLLRTLHAIQRSTVPHGRRILRGKSGIASCPLLSDRPFRVNMCLPLQLMFTIKTPSSLKQDSLRSTSAPS